MKIIFISLLFFLGSNLVGCTQVVNPTQSDLPSMAAELTETEQVISTSTSSYTTTPLPVTETPQPTATSTIPPKVKFHEHCLEILPEVPNKAELTGQAILKSSTEYSVSILDFSLGSQFPFPIPANHWVGGFDVSPDRQKLSYVKSRINDRRETLEQWLVIQDTAGNVLVEKHYPANTLETMYWLDNERLVLGFFAEPHILNPFTGWDYSLSDWYAQSPGGATLDRMIWDVWGVFDSQLSRLLYLQDDETLLLWDVDNQRVLATLDPRIPSYLPMDMPKWSLDNAQIVFAFPAENASEKNQEELFSLSREGQLTQLTHLTDYFQIVEIGNFEWSPDNRYIAFMFTGQDMVEQLAVYDFATGEVRSYCNLSGITGFNTKPIWSPSGDQFMFMRLEADQESYSTILVDITRDYAALLAEDYVPAAWMGNKP